MSTRSTDLPTIQSVKRAVDVLFSFEAETLTLSVAEVADRLGMNRTTAWRYLVTLADTGLLRRSEDDPTRFALGSRVLGLPELFLRQWGDLAAVAKPVLVRLRDETGETAALHLRQGWSRVVVTQIESRHELHRTYRDLGTPLPLHRGAPSTAILAWLRPEEIETHLVSLKEEDPGADIDTLREQLRIFRERGYAVSVAERTPGSASIAAPVFVASERLSASVNISGPTERVVEIGFDQLAPAVLEASRTLSERLGNSRFDNTPARQPHPSVVTVGEPQE